MGKTCWFGYNYLFLLLNFFITLSDFPQNNIKKYTGQSRNATKNLREASCLCGFVAVRRNWNATKTRKHKEPQRIFVGLCDLVSSWLSDATGCT
ncbi:hypothetical protein [Desulfonema magnum]|uniref:hypothetical protein n=1 Tax=Desulfonema magnum TaxID=45655 RepID=UPI001A9B1262|nr:hypothetical protein [Desulfonema magnum]